ncbi:MAG: SseB family protein [Acidobacteriota bacterium]
MTFGTWWPDSLLGTLATHAGGAASGSSSPPARSVPDRSAASGTQFNPHWKHEMIPRNDSVKAAIAQMNQTPSDALRIQFYEALLEDGLLLVPVKKLPPGVGPGFNALEGDVSLSVLTTSSPSGGEAMMAFTDAESLEARAPDATYVGLQVSDVFGLVLQGGYDGMILNAAGPWAGIPRADIAQMGGFEDP